MIRKVLIEFLIDLNFYRRENNFLKRILLNVVKEIYLLDIKMVREITSFLGNGLATVQFTVVCIALLVRVTLTDANIVKYSRQKNKAISFLPAYIVFIKTGDNNVVAKISSHRLPVNGLYAAKSSEAVLPPASPTPNSKAIVRTPQHIPIIQQSLKVRAFIIRGNSNHVIRKIHTLNIIPLTGNAHFSPRIFVNTYSLNPPLRIATGIKHSQTMSDFRMFILSFHYMFY